MKDKKTLEVPRIMPDMVLVGEMAAEEAFKEQKSTCGSYTITMMTKMKY